MPESDPQSQAWQDCPTGQLNDLARHMKSARRSRATRAQLIASGIGLSVVLFGFLLVNNLPWQQSEFDGITCNKLCKLAKQFVAKKLDESTHQQIEEHLQHCASCRKKVDAIKKTNVTRAQLSQESIVSSSVLDSKITVVAR